MTTRVSHLQLQLHVHRPGDRIGAIRRDLPKPQLAVHLDRIFHDGLNCIEPHALITNLSSFRNDGFRQYAAETLSPKCWTEVKPFHLADAILPFVQSYASRQQFSIFGQEQTPVRWSVMAGKPGKFLLKILEAEVHAQRLRVFQEKFPCLRDLCGRLRLRKGKIRICPRYPMSMPPLTLNT